MLTSIKTYSLQLFQVAAMHINADAIIHFGHACLCKVSRLPVHYVFLHFKFDAVKFGQAFHKTVTKLDEKILVFYSNGLYYQLGMCVYFYLCQNDIPNVSSQIFHCFYQSVYL